MTSSGHTQRGLDSAQDTHKTFSPMAETPSHGDAMDVDMTSSPISNQSMEAQATIQSASLEQNKLVSNSNRPPLNHGQENHRSNSGTSDGTGTDQATPAADKFQELLKGEKGVSAKDLAALSEEEYIRTGKRKKKAKRFYCVGVDPDCDMTFSRAEHLARHVRFVSRLYMGVKTDSSDRKHTGERPFECHCLRKFSRLDNLRQHAATVHANEEIPPDSLAATGVRYQRQVRATRGSPPPAGTQLQQGPPMQSNTYGPARRHQRNTQSMPASLTQMQPSSQVQLVPLEQLRHTQWYLRDDPTRTMPPHVRRMYSGDRPSSSQYYDMDGNRHEEPGLAQAQPYRPSSRDYSSARQAPYPPRRLSVSSVDQPYQYSPSYSPARQLAPARAPSDYQARPAYAQANSAYPSPPLTAVQPFQREDVRDDPRRRTWHFSGQFNIPNYASSRLQNVVSYPAEEARATDSILEMKDEFTPRLAPLRFTENENLQQPERRSSYGRDSDYGRPQGLQSSGYDARDLNYERSHDFQVRSGYGGNADHEAHNMATYQTSSQYQAPRQSLPRLSPMPHRPQYHAAQARKPLRPDSFTQMEGVEHHSATGVGARSQYPVPPLSTDAAREPQVDQYGHANEQRARIDPQLTEMTKPSSPLRVVGFAAEVSERAPAQHAENRTDGSQVTDTGARIDTSGLLSLATAAMAQPLPQH